MSSLRNSVNLESACISSRRTDRWMSSWWEPEASAREKDDSRLSIWLRTASRSLSSDHLQKLKQNVQFTRKLLRLFPYLMSLEMASRTQKVQELVWINVRCNMMHADWSADTKMSSEFCISRTLVTCQRYSVHVHGKFLISYHNRCNRDMIFKQFLAISSRCLFPNRMHHCAIKLDIFFAVWNNLKQNMYKLLQNKCKSTCSFHCCCFFFVLCCKNRRRVFLWKLSENRQCRCQRFSPPCTASHCLCIL